MQDDKEDMIEAKAGKKPSMAEEKAEDKGMKKKRMKPSGKNYSPEAMMMAKREMMMKGGK